MWLLHTKTLELRFFTDSESVRYAALSHVWEADDHRQPFREIQAIHSRCLASGEDPRDLVTAKVRNFLALAESEGYEWGWLDTACIDKTSSAELSEAINCMYRWYSDCYLCYAYLYDVSDDENPLLPESGFRSSRWHTRGWTLQELIAPRNVVFLSASWKFIGTKASLAATLQEITRIDLDVLLWRVKNLSSNASIARRMSWAAYRTTTRPEDCAYSLMGIFNVSMPIIYGEGSERAFMRLQTEIMNGSSDQTIFAWGRIHSDWNSAVENLWELMDHRITIGVSVEAGYPNGGLLALSPSQFALSADFRPIDPQTYLGLFGEAIDTNYTIMRNGATLRVPLTSDRAKVRSTVYHAAALACAVGEASIVLLFVARAFSWQLENSPFTCIGASVKLTEYPEFYRGAVLKLPYPLDQGYRYHLKSLRAELSYLSLRELRVGAAYRPDDSSNSLHLDRDLRRGLWTYNHLDGGGVELAFQLPPFVLSDLQKRYGFTQSTSKSPNSRDGLVLEADRKPRFRAAVVSGCGTTCLSPSTIQHLASV